MPFNDLTSMQGANSSETHHREATRCARNGIQLPGDKERLPVGRTTQEVRRLEEIAAWQAQQLRELDADAAASNRRARRWTLASILLVVVAAIVAAVVLAREDDSNDNKPRLNASFKPTLSPSKLFRNQRGITEPGILQAWGI
jgi:hypothetical protein